MNKHLIDKFESKILLLLRFNSPFIPYHCAFSGGKDSILVEYMLKISKCNYGSYFYDNCLTPPNLRIFIKKQYPNVIHVPSKYNLLQLVKRKKILPTRLTRYCCQYFKERQVSNGIIVTGIRSDESCARSHRHEIELMQSDFYRGYKAMLNVILSFTNQEVWELIKAFNLTVPDNYNSVNRIGCIGCPMSGNRRKELLIDYPKFGNMWLKASSIVYEFNKDKFTSGRDVFEWYLADLSIKNYQEYKKQGILNLI